MSRKPTDQNEVNMDMCLNTLNLDIKEQT